MNHRVHLEESEFHARVDAILAAIECALEADADGVDADINAGILTLDFADHSKVIVNRQTPNREIWVAAKSGGYHFFFDGASWRDSRSGESLESLVSRVISMQGGVAPSITL